MKPHFPHRLTGAALLLTLLLTVGFLPAPAAAVESEGVDSPRIEAVAATGEEAETGWVSWLVDTWNELRTFLPGALRSGGDGSDGGDRGSGVDPNGHDHQALLR